MASSLSGLLQSPRHTPLVSGCSGSMARAHSKTLGSSASTSCGLVGRLQPLVGRIVGVIGFVPQVPRQHPPVVPVSADHALHVLPQAVGLRRVEQRRHARTLHPAGIVHAGLGRALACRGPGYGSQQESKSTKIGRILCLSAMLRNLLMRLWNAPASSFHSRSCRNTRIVFIPSPCARFSSVSIHTGSKLSRPATFPTD